MDSTKVGYNIEFKCSTRTEVANIEKLSSLLHCGKDYNHKKIYVTGPRKCNMKFSRL